MTIKTWRERMTPASRLPRAPEHAVYVAMGAEIHELRMTLHKIKTIDLPKPGTCCYCIGDPACRPEHAAGAISKTETTEVLIQALDAMSPLQDLIMLRQACDAIKRVLEAAKEKP